MSGVIDARAVGTRDGRWRTTINGRPTCLAPETTPSAALLALSRALDAAAWTSGRSELAEAEDPSSPIYAGGD